MEMRIKPCQVCGGKIGHVFYVVKMAQCVLDTRATNEYIGLATLFGGNESLAQVFSSHHSLEHVIDGKDANGWPEITVCQKCAVSSEIGLAIWTKKEKEGDGHEQKRLD